MTFVVITLLLMIGSATARSLSSKQNAMIKKLKVTRREAQSKGQNDAVISNFTKLQADIASMSIPSYLKDLYINLTLGGDILSDNRINTVRAYKDQANCKDNHVIYITLLRKMYLLDVITYKFATKISLLVCINASVLSYTDAKCGHVMFHMDNHTMNEEEIITIELHLFQNNLTEFPSHYNVDIFFLLSGGATESPLKLTVKHIDSTPGWKKINITTIARLWKYGWPNYGLQVRLTKGEKILPCKGVFTKGQDPHHTHNQPLLVMFTHDPNSRSLTRILKDYTSLVNHSTIQQNKRDATNVQNVGCHLKEMILTADSLNSTDIRVLLPKSFDVGICEGHCKKLQPTPHTDHAYILSLYYRNNVDLSEIPSKCCVPASYGNTNMLFYNGTNHEYIFKKDVEIKAKGCVCL